MTDRYLVLWYDGNQNRATIVEDDAEMGPERLCSEFPAESPDMSVNYVVELPPAGNVGPEWRPAVWIDGNEAPVSFSKT